ncbi:MAG: hypothetical protein ACOYXB_11710 [Bacteroidota bacterium]
MKTDLKSPIALLAGILLMLTACSQEKTDMELTVSNEIVNPAYIGNGIEWDPYDEAARWGSEISDADWEKLLTRLDFMRPRFVRCMINSPYRYFDKETGRYDKTRNNASIIRLLSYCQENNITVLFGEYNPPDWSMKEDTAWINMSVDYLNYLVGEQGFTCIKYFNLFNEPDGYWSSTNGDYELWKKMVLAFTKRMQTYPALAGKVSMGGPDVVMAYRNPASAFEPWEWIGQTAADMDSLIGLYDFHAYPGQHEVRSGEFAAQLKEYTSRVPEGKKIVLGEAGYKYYKPEDSRLMEEQNRRLKDHPFTKGSDCNMLVYDFFYGLDMPLLCMEIMNNGLSGMAVWMLDDAMHSNGDAGNITDIKLWGMWNILGEEVFGKAEEENVRPWYYTWSLMCRYFPDGTDILRIEGNSDNAVRVAAGKKDGKTVIALVNTGADDRLIGLSLPSVMRQAKMYVYRENDFSSDENGIPVPVKTDLNFDRKNTVQLHANSFVLITDRID